MEKCKDSLYLLEDTEIFYDNIKDSLYSFRKFHSLISGENLDENKNVSPIILIKNCKLPDNSTCSVNNIIFHKNATFHGCEGALQFRFVNCTFLPTEVKPVICFCGGKYDDIGFEGINFSNSILDFTNYSVKENLTIQDCKFNQPIGTTKFNFPKDNTSFNWSQLDSVGLSIIIYIIFLAFIRALNSTTLSINVFSTLGFGAIPVKGVSKYITILEGFLGWFLLSIFSISLISQMIQN